MRKVKGRTHLFFTDSHANPYHDNDRFTLLGKLAKDIKPDVMVCGGDFADMYSLNSFERGTKGFMMKANYKDDVASTIDAQEKIVQAMGGQYDKTYMVMLGGNHDEARIDRALSVSPELPISLEDLQYEKYWDEYIPFLDIAEIDGVCYSHYLKAGNSGRAIASKYMGNALLSKAHGSMTVGHCHLFNHMVMTNIDGKKMHGLSGGCFFTHPEGYAKQNEQDWDRGVVVKRNVKDGEYNLQWISMRTLEEEYG